MTPASFFGPKLGQSLLLPGQNEGYRGQCVQSVGLWVQALGLEFPEHLHASDYWDYGIPGYVPIQPGEPIKTADIVIWKSSFPPSLGAGHIDVAAQDGLFSDFTAYDQNWYPPLLLELIRHNDNNNNYIAGYLRRTGTQDMTKAEAYTVTDGFYRWGTGQPPSPEQSEYWAARISDPTISTGLDELYQAMKKQAADQADYVAYSGPPLFTKK